MEKFVASILKNLEMNGFPTKKVSLPTEKMYEIADTKGLSLNKVLDHLEEEHQISSDIGDEKIVFIKVAPEAGVNNPFAGMDQAQMMQKAQEMMSQMDPTELKRMQDMFMNMSEEEKADIMKKGKDMGLI